jgi:UDP-N-acetyl-D-galactosamine dehydrogenase
MKEYGMIPIITDPQADAEEARKEYGVELVSIDQINNMDAVIIAVAHNEYLNLTKEKLDRLFKKVSNNNKAIVDIKGILDRRVFEDAGYRYWRL